VILQAHGIRIELPHGWSGRLFNRAPGTATLHAASYTLTLDDGQFGDRSTARMASGACFLALTEYLAADGLHPGQGLFGARKMELPLDPARFSARALAHPRPGQVGSQQFFTAAGRPFCLYVVLAGVRTARPRQLAVLHHLLRTLNITARGG